jgi:hypothetical protein
MVVVVMAAPMRVSRSVNVSVSLRHADRRLSKAVSARIAVLQVAVCRVKAATATSGGCCRASCRGDAVAMVAQVVRKEEGCLPRENIIIEAGRRGAAKSVLLLRECQGRRLVGRNARCSLSHKTLPLSMQGVACDASACTAAVARGKSARLR